MRDAAAAAGAALVAALNPHATKAAVGLLLAGTEQVGRCCYGYRLFVFGCRLDFSCAGCLLRLAGADQVCSCCSA